MDPNDSINDSKDKDEIKVVDENDEGRIEDGINSEIETDNEDGSRMGKNANRDGGSGKNEDKDGGTSENKDGGHGGVSEDKDSGASKNENSGHGGSELDSDSRGQGKIRYAPSTPSPLTANRSVLALQ
jgi:hypothetical protein